MSSPLSAPPLRLEPRPSRRLRALLAVAHAGGALLVIPLPFPLVAQIALLTLLAFSLYALHAPAPGLHLWNGDGDWSGPAGESLRFDGESFVAPWLVIVNLRTEAGRRRTLVLLPDSLDADTLRRLRTRLRLEAGREQ